MRSRHIYIDDTEPKYKGKYEVQMCATIKVVIMDENHFVKTIPWHREAIKQLVKVAVHPFTVEKDDPQRMWFDVYLDELTLREDNSWYVCVIQEWLD